MTSSFEAVANHEISRSLVARAHEAVAATATATARRRLVRTSSRVTSRFIVGGLRHSPESVQRVYARARAVRGGDDGHAHAGKHVCGDNLLFIAEKTTS